MNSALTPASPRPRLAARSESVPPPGLNRNDILFALFRHKKMIAILTLLGFVAAAAVYFFYPPSYQSEAKLLVRYVLDRSVTEQLLPLVYDELRNLAAARLAHEASVRRRGSDRRLSFAIPLRTKWSADSSPSTCCSPLFFVCQNRI